MSFYEELKRRNVIRVATAYVVGAWLAIQVVETVLPAFGFTDRAVRVVVILFAIGFVPAVIGAWVFQITPEGLMRDRGSDAGRGSPAVSRNLDRAIIVLLALGVSYFAFDKFVIAPERAAEREAEIAEQARAEAQLGFYGDRSIAVLPFDNLSPDPEQQYFVDGVAEEILNLLARIRDLRVISRSSSFTFRDENIAIPEIAERLNVGYVLEGSVRRAGNSVRVTAQLIEGNTDAHLWSRTYERELDDVFEIQDEIAADVVRNLELNLSSPLPGTRKFDPEAMALTQQAKALSERRGPNVGENMYKLLSRAVEIDPGYVPAWEWLVSAHFFRQRAGKITAAEARPLYEAIQARILELEPESAFVDVMNAWRLGDTGQLEAAARLYGEALAKDVSDSNAVRIAGTFAHNIGKLDVAIRLHEHAVAIDPLCFQCLYRLSRAHFYAENFETSLEVRERYLVLGDAGEYHFGLALLLMSRPREALDFYLGMPGDEPQAWAGRAMALQALGRVEESAAALERLLEMAGPFSMPLAAEVASYSGDHDRAFEWIAESDFSNHPLGRLDVFNPIWKPLHGDPRWHALRKRIGMSEERLDAIEFDPELPE